MNFNQHEHTLNEISAMFGFWMREARASEEGGEQREVWVWSSVSLLRLLSSSLYRRANAFPSSPVPLPFRLNQEKYRSSHRPPTVPIDEDRPSLNNLPDEILERIVAFLPKGPQFALCRVSLRFLRIASYQLFASQRIQFDCIFARSFLTSKASSNPSAFTRARSSFSSS